MSISSEELADLLERTTHGISPAATDAIRTAVNSIRIRRISAELDSAHSHHLRSTIDAHQEILDPDAIERFSNVGVYGVDFHHANALACTRQSEPCIVVFKGFLDLIRYFASLVTVMSELQHHRANAVIYDGEGRAHSEVELFSLAGFSNLADFIISGRPLVPLRDMLGSQAGQNVDLGVAVSTIFILLHELGHVELGHLRKGTVRAETTQIALLEPQALNREQTEELEADAFALKMIQPEYRALIQSSLIFALGSFAFLEAFSGGKSKSHPFTFNRLSKLAEASNLSKIDRQIVEGWIEDRVRNFRSLSNARADPGGNIIANIGLTMPRDHALSIIHEVRRRVAADHGVLG